MIDRQRTILTVALAGCLAVALLAGCSAQTRDKGLDFFFARCHPVMAQQPPQAAKGSDVKAGGK